jgi:hypothetical protein
VNRLDAIGHQPFVLAHVRHFEVQGAPGVIVGRCSVREENSEISIVANRRRGSIGRFKLDFEVEMLPFPEDGKRASRSS